MHGANLSGVFGGVLSDVNGEKRSQDDAGHNDSHDHEDRYQASGQHGWNLAL
jgi:hypothetical protein